jgi:uncharacterized protein
VKARGAVVGTLLVVLLLSALYPIRQYFTQKTQIKNLSAEEVQLTERIKDLNEQRARLLTEDEIERIAREELGMVRPGEIAFAIVPGADTAAKKGRSAVPAVDTGKAKSSGTSWYERWWDAVVDSITGMR